MNKSSPIPLINIDAKVGSKTIENRVEKILQKLIHYNQCAYVKDRSTSDTLRTVGDI